MLSFPPYPGDYLHPVVYACTAVMLLCMLVSIFTYIVHYRYWTPPSVPTPHSPAGFTLHNNANSVLACGSLTQCSLYDI